MITTYSVAINQKLLYNLIHIKSSPRARSVLHVYHQKLKYLNQSNAMPSLVYITLCEFILHISNCWMQFTRISLNNTFYHYNFKNNTF